MRLFLDTADVQAVRELWAWGAFAGVTTNPILLGRAGVRVEEAVARLGEAMPGEVFAQARGETAEALARDGARLARLLPGRMVIKVPVTAAGLEAMHRLAGDQVLCAATAVFRASQALLAARAGAHYAIPFWHRIAEAGGDPAGEVGRAARLLERLAAAGVRARVLAASLRTPEEAMAAFTAGAHAVTVGPEVARGLLEDPGTRATVAEFVKATGKE